MKGLSLFRKYNVLQIVLCIIDILLSTIEGNALDPFVSLEMKLLVALADNLF